VDEFLSEKEQWEMLKGWMRVNGAWIAAGILCGGLLLMGWRYWEARVDRLALEASAKYQELVLALDKGDKTRAQTLTIELERDYASSPYVDQAHLVGARVAVEAGELDKAADLLTSVMSKTKDKQLAQIARLRLARVQLARSKPDEALATLDATDPGAFAARFHEARGDVYFAKGDKANALKEYQAARAGAITQSVDSQMLDLKITDLMADAPAPAVPAAPKTAEAK